VATDLITLVVDKEAIDNIHSLEWLVWWSPHLPSPQRLVKHYARVQTRWHVRGKGHPGTQRIYACT